MADDPLRDLSSTYSLEAEKSLLGILLWEEEVDALDEVSRIVKEQDFYSSHHQAIFSVMLHLQVQKTPVDIISVTEHLQRVGQLDQVGGSTFLSLLIEQSPTSYNVGSYAKLIAERSVLRSLYNAGNEIIKLGLNPDRRDTKELIEAAEQKVFEIAEKENGGSSFVPLGQPVNIALDQASTRSNFKDELVGFPTGFFDLDEKTDGLQRGDLIVLAGRPAMGKTALGINIARHVSSSSGDYKHKFKAPPLVGVFSMEMGAEQIALRMLSTESDVELGKLRAGRMSDAEWNRFHLASSALGDELIYIDDTTGLTVHNLRGRGRRLKKNHPNLGLIIIDYLQLLRIDKKMDNRTAEVTEITRTLKEMARELDVPVMVLSQLNRALEGRKGNSPMMSDLRESGSIEQDADIIMFIHRREVFNKEDESLKGKAELIIAKHRNGETGTINLVFEGKVSKFTGLKETIANKTPTNIPVE